MSTSTHSCGVCELRHITKCSIIWCTECDEGLCTECQEHHSLSKSSRNHNTLPITNYQKLPPDVLKISKYCEKHNEQFQIYCKNHESPCCSNCVVESHNECREFTKLSEAILNAKTSNAFVEIEHFLAEVSENITKIRENRQENMKKISEKRMQIEQEIEQTRIIINNHLDKLQEKLRKELCEIEEKENKEICQLISMLEEKENDIAECQTNILSIKQYASDLQAFVSMKKLESEVSLKDEFLQSLINKAILKQHSLVYHLDSALQDFLSNTHTFGQVVIEAKPINVVVTRTKGKHAQIMVPEIKTGSIEDISMKLLKTIHGTGDNIYGFCMLQDGKMAFTNNKNSIKILNNDGSLHCCVNTPDYAFDVEYINKIEAFAVSGGYHGKHNITFINMTDKQVKKTIPLESAAYGIAKKDAEFIIFGNQREIQMISVQNETVHRIVSDKMSSGCCYVATFEDNIYLTNGNSNTVTCYNQQGKTQWTFKNESVLKFPVGISVDNSGNAFIIGNQSNNVIAISPGGKQYRQLLSSIDGLSSPYTLHYDRSTNQLLVANFQNKAFIYTFM
ncbi:unnamed protein product [Mytilus coruscus]|uniref:B box-type domain-containing protein n=1 Tax=Mytilus coruscus TaxID=42192 RepID=A0A6J8DUJ9_MYTCO|nr:unnamed protein product [Mytilus coruscus]